MKKRQLSYVTTYCPYVGDEMLHPPRTNSLTRIQIVILDAAIGDLNMQSSLVLKTTNLKCTAINVLQCGSGRGIWCHATLISRYPSGMKQIYRPQDQTVNCLGIS